MAYMVPSMMRRSLFIFNFSGEDMKKRIYNIILFIIFLTGLFLMLYKVNFVFRQKEFSGVQDKFAALEEDSIDVVFVGNSHQFCSISPEILYEEYDMETFMLATSAQTVPMSYYATMEAIELQHPKVIIFEVSYCANDFRTVSEEMSHCFFDGMPRCRARKEGIRDLIEKENQIYYYLNLELYHTRWKELTKEDYVIQQFSDRGGVYYKDTFSNWEIPLIEESETEAMPDEMKKYLDKMVELCRENDVRLILYVAPFNTMYGSEEEVEDLYRRQRIFNGIAVYAKKHELEYYNLFYEMDEIGLDYATDWLDSQHLNCIGQAKLTRYMVERGYIEAFL